MSNCFVIPLSTQHWGITVGNQSSWTSERIRWSNWFENSTRILDLLKNVLKALFVVFNLRSVKLKSPISPALNWSSGLTSYGMKLINILASQQWHSSWEEDCDPEFCLSKPIVYLLNIDVFSQSWDSTSSQLITSPPSVVVGIGSYMTFWKETQLIYVPTSTFARANNALVHPLGMTFHFQ